MLVDKTGRKLKPGQFVDMKTDSIITGQIMEVHDSVIEVPGQGRTIPYVVIHALKFQVSIDGVKDKDTAVVGKVYIVADAPPDFEKTHPQNNGVGDGGKVDGGKVVLPFESGTTKDGKAH